MLSRVLSRVSNDAAVEAFKQMKNGKGASLATVSVLVRSLFFMSRVDTVYSQYSLSALRLLLYLRKYVIIT